MARAEQTVTADFGRDKGKQFFIREMAASQGERWAVRAFLALGRNGVELPEGIENTGMAGIARLGLSLFLRLPFEECQALMDEMFGCLQFIPDASKPDIRRALVEDDIEEVGTRMMLRKAIFMLHVNPYLAAVQST